MTSLLVCFVGSIGAWFEDGPIVCGGIIQNPYKYADECLFLSSAENQMQWAKGPTLKNGRTRGRGLADAQVNKQINMNLITIHK